MPRMVSFVILLKREENSHGQSNQDGFTWLQVYSPVPLHAHLPADGFASSEHCLPADDRAVFEAAGATTLANGSHGHCHGLSCDFWL